MNLSTHPSPADTLTAVVRSWRNAGLPVRQEVVFPRAPGISREWLSEWLLHDIPHYSVSDRLTVAIVK